MPIRAYEVYALLYPENGDVIIVFINQMTESAILYLLRASNAFLKKTCQACIRLVQ